MKKDKILINIEDLNYIEKFKKIGYNNFLFAVDKFSIGYKSFQIKDLINLDCNKYLLLNRVLYSDDLDELKNMINELEKFDGIFFEDIGIYNIFKDTNIKLIWNQNHFATNYSSINYWLENVYSVQISNEITLEEINEILDKSNKKLVLNVFGKNQLMYSRRTLLSNFNSYFKLDNIKEAILDEIITSNEFFIKEDNNGTILFNNTYFNIINILDKINDSKILFYLIYPNELDFDEICNVINDNSKIKYNDGFINKKTIYKLEGIK